MSIGLDPAQLTPAASLNRVRFVDLPGIALPSDVLGRTAYELLSARALADLARQHADALGLACGRAADSFATLEQLDHGLADGPPATREAAEATARRFGERLGWLIVTLRRGDAASRVARPDWDDTYWRHWAGISTIYLGGGVASGRLGPRLVEHASRTLAEARMADCAIRLAPWPALLPTIGAARTAPPEPTATVILDFGHSFIKRAVAQYEAGTVAALRLFARLPACRPDVSAVTEPTAEHVERLGEHMAVTMAETWRAARALDSHMALTIVTSLASYVRDGQPLARQGGMYATLVALSDNLSGWLAERISSSIGCPLKVRLLHDGTAAAGARAGEGHAAVITLGTALGVGFPPVSGPSYPVSPRMTVTAARAG